jgi:hypothetical protein
MINTVNWSADRRRNFVNGREKRKVLRTTVTGKWRASLGV